MVQSKQTDACRRTRNKMSSTEADALAEDICYVEVE